MTTIQFRRATAAEWAADNPILAEGEPGYETDTGREKRGNGVSSWLDLAYVGINDTDFSFPVRSVQGDTGDVRLSLGNIDGVDLDIQDIDEFGNIIEPGPTLGEFLGWDANGVARNLPVNSETLGIDARFEPRDPLSKYRLYGHAVPRGGTVPSDLPDNAWVFDENKPDLALIGDIYRVTSTATTVLPTYLDYVNYSVTLGVGVTSLQLPAAPADGAVYIEVSIIQDATTGSRTVSWPTNVVWDKVGGSNAAPTLETGTSAKNRFRFKSAGGQWECVGRWAYAGGATAGPTPTWVAAMSDQTAEPQDTGLTATWPVVSPNDVFVGIISVSGGDVATNAQFDWTTITNNGFVLMDGPITNHDTTPTERVYLLKKKLTGNEDNTSVTFPYDPTLSGGTDRGVLAGGIFRGADFDRITSVPNRDTTQDTTFEYPEFTVAATNAMLAELTVLRTAVVALTAAPTITMSDTSWTERVDIYAGDTTLTNAQARFIGHMATKGLTGAGGLQAATSQTATTAVTFAGFMVIIPPVNV